MLTEREYAVAVLVVSPDGIPLVRDPQKGIRGILYWKAPGGRNKAGESAMDTAIREVEEETGVGLTEKDLVLIARKDDPSHDLYFYVTEVVRLTGIKARGKKNEEVRVFLPHEVLALQDFFRNHRNVFSRYLLALVVGLDEYLAVVHLHTQGR